MTEQQLYDIRDTKKSVGSEGEDFVFRYECQRLTGHTLLSEVSIVGRNDIGLGYDICSFNGLTSSQLDRYIEVKTYVGLPHFFLSQGEWSAAVKYANRYYIYLIDYTKINSPGYEPTIICNPVRALAANENWAENIQLREYTLAIPQQDSLPVGFDDATILVGCFKDNPHKNWILHYHAYNVRRDIADTYFRNRNMSNFHQQHLKDLKMISRKIPGAVTADEIGTSVSYLLLYNICEPRSYRIYTVTQSRIATNSDLRRLNYPSPRCPEYILYKLSGVADDFPAVDIMRLLRSNNDKVLRTSGTPVFISGKELRNYFIDATACRLTGASAPKRIFTNEGKVWSRNQSMRLEVLMSMHKDIAAIAHELKRTPDEIHAQLKVLGLE